MIHLLSALPHSAGSTEWHGPNNWGVLWEHINKHLFTLPTTDDHGILTSLIVLVSGIVVAFALLRWRKARHWLMGHLMGCAVALFLAGVALYVVGFNHEGTAQNATALLLRSMTASMEMFVSESELIEVDETVKCNMAYMTVFAIVHFLAVCVSAAFILHLLGVRAVSYVRMCWLANVLHKRNKDVFVFFDLSEESLHLASDIHAHYKEHGDLRHCRIIFVRTPAAESHLERFSFAHILSLSSAHNDRVERLMDIDAFITYSRQNVEIHPDGTPQNDQARQPKKLKSKEGLSTLQSYLQRRARTIRFFCLTDNEEANLTTAIALNDLKHTVTSHGTEVDVYCHVHRSPLARTFASTGIHLIDSAGLSVMQLKDRLECQPVSYVPVDTESAGVTRPFRALIVGMGTNGTEMLKFLYEFASFVDPSGHTMAPHFTIIDPFATARRDALFLQCPALEGDECLEFLDGTIESNRQRVADLIGRKADEAVDYVAVCTSDDGLNVQLGAQLMQLAFRHRNGQHRLGIYVNVYSDKEYAKAERMANGFNHCTDKVVNDGSHEMRPSCDFHLHAFGAMKQIFTYDIVVSDQRRENAIHFFAAYNHCGSDLAHNEWKAREDNSRMLPQQKDEECILEKRNKLTQNKIQDFGNVWHMATKLALMGINHKPQPAPTSSPEALSQWQRKHDEEVERRNDLLGCLEWAMTRLEEAGKNLKNPEEKVDSYGVLLSAISEYEQKQPGLRQGSYSTLFVNLARCEHLRWWAMNKTLGFTGPENPTPRTLQKEKDYIRLRHWCMVSNPLMECVPGLRDTIQFDFKTILVTLRLDAEAKTKVLS